MNYELHVRIKNKITFPEQYQLNDRHDSDIVNSLLAFACSTSLREKKERLTNNCARPCSLKNLRREKHTRYILTVTRVADE